MADAFKMHPNYLSEDGRRWQTARQSIVKRVVGAVTGYAEQSAQGRSGLGQRLNGGRLGS